MYVNYKSINYPCICHPAQTMVYQGLPDDFPAPVNSPITLCADDGFVMRVDDPADYLRQTFCAGVLTLTNVPEPEPVSELEPVEPVPTLEERVADLEEQLAAAKILLGVSE